MRTHHWLGILYLCLSGLLCLGGCGKETVPNIGMTGKAETSADEGWKVTGLPVSDKVGEETALWAARYDRWPHEDIHYDPSTEKEPSERNAIVLGEQIYRCCYVSPQEGNEGRGRDILEIYDVLSGESSVTELDGELLGAGDGFIASMYVAEPGKYVFRILDEQVNKIVYSDLGEQTQVMDVLPVCQEKGIADQLCNECICDSEGNTYIRDSRWQELYIFGRDGGLLMEYQGEKGDNIRAPFTMPSGELIFPIYNSEEKVCRLVWFDTEQKKEHIVSSFESYPIESVYGVQGSDIYYEAWEGIVKWDISSGDRVLVYHFDQDCISRMYRTMLVLREGQPPVLRMYGTVNKETEDWLVALSAEEPEPGEVIRIAGLVQPGATMFDGKSAAGAMSRKYRNTGFVYESYENADQINYQSAFDSSYLEDYRTRIFAELAAGGGPDIMLVSLQDMRLLQEQGYLLDLRSVLSEESLNRILPNVLEMGTVDNTLVGLAPAVQVTTAITMKSIWDQDTWTLEDVLDLMDTGEFTGVMCQGTSRFAPQAVIKLLTGFGLMDSSLVDWETGKSYFDSDHFIRLLHVVKACSDIPWNQETWLGTGGCPMQLAGLGISSINEFYDQYGEDYCVVGVPSIAGNGNYISCGGVLAVNRKLSDPEAAAAFFEYLLGEEIQDSKRMISEKSILKVSAEDIEYREEGGERKAYWKDHELRIMEGGTTTFDDYAAYLESCVPSPVIAEEDLIKSIVWEEAEAYINGDKSAEEVAGIIHSRVQLYLDENQIKNK